MRSALAAVTLASLVGCTPARTASQPEGLPIVFATNLKYVPKDSTNSRLWPNGVYTITLQPSDDPCGRQRREIVGESQETREMYLRLARLDTVTLHSSLYGVPRLATLQNGPFTGACPATENRQKGL